MSACGARHVPLKSVGTGCQGCGDTSCGTWNGYCGACVDKVPRCERYADHHGEPHGKGDLVWPSSPGDFTPKATETESVAAFVERVAGHAEHMTPKGPVLINLEDWLTALAHLREWSAQLDD